MALALNGAQRLAVLRQHDVQVTFHVDDRTFEILQDANNNGEADEGEDVRLRQLPETVGFSAGTAPALPEGEGPVTFTAAEGDPFVTFHRNGSASDAGAIYLRPLEGSLSFDDEGVRAVTVERATGGIRCFSYRTGSWEGTC